MRTFFLIFILILLSLNIFPQSKGIETGLYIVLSKKACLGQKNISKITYQSDTLCLKNKPIITLRDIELCFSDSTKLDGQNTYALNIKLKKSMIKKFKTITEKNVGKRIAMIIDKKVIMAAVLRDPITTGRLTVSGESVEKLKELEIKLNKELKEINK